MTITAAAPEASFLDRRLARRFRTYDDNGNGFIEKCDFENAVARLGEEFGHGADSPALQKLLNLSLRVWERMLEVADTNHDGKISEDEYKTAFKKGLLETPEDFEAVYTTFLNAIMDVIDADKDGKLTAEDEVRWTRALMHLPEEHAREAFRRMDKDGDGYITTQNLVDNIRGYYFDESDESPGYWLLGPLD